MTLNSHSIVHESQAIPYNTKRQKRVTLREAILISHYEFMMHENRFDCFTWFKYLYTHRNVTVKY